MRMIKMYKLCMICIVLCSNQMLCMLHTDCSAASPALMDGTGITCCNIMYLPEQIGGAQCVIWIVSCPAVNPSPYFMESLYKFNP
ncbi:hypothetical protein GDO86_017654 [Hymenochirus boettgeri]|uniref:Secreted protein n=1 Tax=Hymenochirus boettgeri TaxID=247094 RepID=A0A8T2IKH4_9PIPI|nr:hypothetical protein GDO86_017654 [Hymenochirus boettgeri]